MEAESPTTSEKPPNLADGIVASIAPGGPTSPGHPGASGPPRAPDTSPSWSHQQPAAVYVPSVPCPAFPKTLGRHAAPRHPPDERDVLRWSAAAVVSCRDIRPGGDSFRKGACHEAVQELLGGGQARLWTDPAARFSLELPAGWTAQPPGTGSEVFFQKHHAGHGFVARATIQTRNVPLGVELSHLVVRVADEMKRSTYQYRPVARERRTVSGQPAVLHRFTHQERGHTALRNEVQQAIFIVKERAFVVTIEMVAGSRPAFQEDIDKILTTVRRKPLREKKQPRGQRG